MDELAASRVLARVRDAVLPRAHVELYGSSVYAPAHASDVDVLVAYEHLAVEPVSEAARLASVLGMEAIATTPPRVHGVLDGAPVDISIVTGDGELARRMRSGPADAAELVAQLRASDREPAFAAAWPHVRRFVRARALGHNGLGWFGSFGWALLLAIPLVVDPGLREVAPGAVVPAWLRWLAALAPSARVAFEGIARPGDPAAPLHLAAPTPPTRDVARLTKRAAGWLFAEARAAAAAIGDAATDEAAIACIADLAATPPPGTTLVIAGDGEASRGRYDGNARGLVRELEALGAARSWGRFDDGEDGGWEHRITVPAPRANAARTRVEDWLAITRIDATVV